jgi:hypothetical protein
MAYFVANVYTVDGVGGVLFVSSTPNDGIQNNLLIGTRASDSLFGENGANLYQEYFGLRGDDRMYAGVGTNNDSAFIGGSGVDTAIIPAASFNTNIAIDYQGGVVVDVPGTGSSHYVNSETEIIEFNNGHRLLPISGGVDDRTSEVTWINYVIGDALAIGMDWIVALGQGLVGLEVSDVNFDGFMDTGLVGIQGVNTYVLLGYNAYLHPGYVAGWFGDGIIFELA